MAEQQEQDGRGPVLASFQVRITVREARPDPSAHVPTNESLAATVKEAIEQEFDVEATVRSERLDK